MVKFSFLLSFFFPTSSAFLLQTKMRSLGSEMQAMPGMSVQTKANVFLRKQGKEERQL